MPHATNVPDAHYLQHHQVEPPRIDASAFRPTWKVKTRLDRLAIEGAITLDEYRAALHFRRSVEVAFGRLLRARDLECAIGVTRQGGRGTDPTSHLALAACQRAR